MIQNKKKRDMIFTEVCFPQGKVKSNLGEIDLKCVDKTRLGESSSFFCLDDIALTYRIHNKHENSIL